MKVIWSHSGQKTKTYENYILIIKQQKIPVWDVSVSIGIPVLFCKTKVDDIDLVKENNNNGKKSELIDNSTSKWLD